MARGPPWQKWCWARVGWCAGCISHILAFFAFLTFVFSHFSHYLFCISRIFLSLRFSDYSSYSVCFPKVALVFVETLVEGIAGLHTGQWNLEMCKTEYSLVVLSPVNVSNWKHSVILTGHNNLFVDLFGYQLSIPLDNKPTYLSEIVSAQKLSYNCALKLTNKTISVWFSDLMLQWPAEPLTTNLFLRKVQN